MRNRCCPDAHRDDDHTGCGSPAAPSASLECAVTVRLTPPTEATVRPDPAAVWLGRGTASTTHQVCPPRRTQPTRKAEALKRHISDAVYQRLVNDSRD